MLMVHSVTLARLDILPEDGPTETETCGSMPVKYNIEH